MAPWFSPLLVTLLSASLCTCCIQSLLKETHLPRGRWSFSPGPLLYTDVFQGNVFFVKAICFCKIWKKKIFQLMSLSTQACPQPPFSSYQVPVWRRDKRDVQLRLEIHLFGFLGHIHVFWRKSCLYLIVATCPNVADGFQYIPTAHCAESPGSCDKETK